MLGIYLIFIIIINMQGNKSSIDTKYSQLSAQMAKASGLKPQQLSKVQKTVIFAHLVNRQFGLRCVNRNGEVQAFSQNWSEAKEGVYRFNYKAKENSDLGQKIIQFRFVNNQQPNGTISINFSVQDSQELHQYELSYQSQKIQDCFKSYQKILEEKLNKKKQQKKLSEPPRTLQPQWRTPLNNGPRQPQPMHFIPTNRGGNFNGPFSTGGEYIGPDNQIFRGRGGMGNPLIDRNPQSLNDPRRPLGSRFDPLDPFGSLGDQNPRGGGRDFTGFNEFGQPFGGSRGGFNQGSRFF